MLDRTIGASCVGLITSLLSLSATADMLEGGRGMLFGEDHAFAVTAKAGWILDNQSGISQGLHMVFYPKGETWANSPVIIYGRTTPTTEATNVKAQVERTVREFHSNGSPDYASEIQVPLTLPDGHRAEVYRFSGDQWGNHEAAVYFQETDTINFLVFNARTKTNFDKYIDDFRHIAMSYQNLYVPAEAVTEGILDALRRESSSVLKSLGGKEYETKAVQSVSQTMATVIQGCASYLHDKELREFSYFVRINRDGSINDSYISQTNALTACFKGMMASVTYPPHGFESFVLDIEMKFSP